MRKLFILFVLALAIFSFLYKRIDQPIEEFKPLVAVVHYTASNCSECQALEHQLNKIAWILGKEPVLFVAYTLQNNFSKQQAEKKLQPYQIVEIIQKNYHLQEACIIDLKTKKIVGKLSLKDNLEAIEKKIKFALGKK